MPELKGKSQTSTDLMYAIGGCNRKHPKRTAMTAEQNTPRAMLRRTPESLNMPSRAQKNTVWVNRHAVSLHRRVCCTARLTPPHVNPRSAHGAPWGPSTCDHSSLHSCSPQIQTLSTADIWGRELFAGGGRGGCAAHCGVFSRTSGLDPGRCQQHAPLTVTLTKHVSRSCQICPEEQNRRPWRNPDVFPEPL